MPDPLLLDTHVHFWDHSLVGFRWPWLEPGFAHRKVRDTHRLDAPRYTTPEFRAESAGAGVGGMIHAQAATGMDDPSAETAWLEEIASEQGWPNGIIGSCTLAAPDAPAVLQRHAAHPRASSVRDITAPNGLDVEAAAAALDTAAEIGFSIELRMPTERFDVLAALADRWPEVTFVLSHAALPLERTDESLAEWTDAASELARRENWVCKISAVAGASDPTWTVPSITPWILRCVDVFGPDRCMFGTNWPIDRLFGRYVDVVAAYREVTAPLDRASQEALFHGTASRVYRVPVEDLRDPAAQAPKRDSSAAP